MSDHPPFPLPLGHTYGPSGSGNSVMIHNGRDDYRDRLALVQWGRAYKGRIRRPHFEPSGTFDGTYQRAVLEIQGLAGLARTGLLGWEEWPLAWTLEPPPAKYIRPGGEHAETQAKQHKANIKDYWRRYSKYDIHPGSAPGAPTWFPGRPFGHHERGEHVKPIQHYFGMAEHGRFTAQLQTKVRGYQRTRQLPITGIVDARTASYMQAEMEEPAPTGAGSSLLGGQERFSWESSIANTSDSA